MPTKNLALSRTPDGATYVVLSEQGFWGRGASPAEANDACEGTTNCKRALYRVAFADDAAREAQRKHDAEHEFTAGYNRGVLHDGRPYATVTDEGGVARCRHARTEKIGEIVKRKLRPATPHWLVRIDGKDAFSGPREECEALYAANQGKVLDLYDPSGRVVRSSHITF